MIFHQSARKKIKIIHVDRKSHSHVLHQESSIKKGVTTKFLFVHHIFSITDDKIYSSLLNLLIQFYLLAHLYDNKR